MAISVLLSSCSTTRNTAPTSAEEFARLVLVLNELPEGELSYSWHHHAEFDLSPYAYSPRNGRSPGRVVMVAASRQRDCDAELQECMRECMSRPLARGFGHITSGGRKKGGKEEYCNGQCGRPYQDCMDLQDLKLREFTGTDDAVDWISHHRKEIVVGGVLVIAGVTFVVVSAGLGIIILAPAVLLTGSEQLPESGSLAVSP